MGDLEKKKNIGYICIVVGVIIAMFSWKVLFDDIENGGGIGRFVFLWILGIVVVFIGIYLIKKCEETIRLENARKQKEVLKACSHIF